MRVTEVPTLVLSRAWASHCYSLSSPGLGSWRLPSPPRPLRVFSLMSPAPTSRSSAGCVVFRPPHVQSLAGSGNPYPPAAFKVEISIFCHNFESRYTFGTLQTSTFQNKIITVFFNFWRHFYFIVFQRQHTSHPSCTRNIGEGRGLCQRQEAEAAQARGNG